jgi:outer membrane receptor protein involved in Fe transport
MNMGNTVAEVADVLQALEMLEPILATFVPGAAAWLPLFNIAVQATQTVANDTGKPLQSTITDVINHLTPGQPNAPSLS